MNNLDIFEKFVIYSKNGEACVLCTVVEESGSTPRGVGAAMLVLPGGKIDGTVGGGVTEYNVIKRAAEMIDTGEEFFLFREELAAQTNEETAHLHAACGGALGVFMQSAASKKRLIIFGAGHVGVAIAELGVFAGFDVTIWDERPEFANIEKIPYGKVVCCTLIEVHDKIIFGSDPYFVVVTRGHSLDTDVMRLLENVPAKYIGVIGSRPKIAYVREKLLKEGVSSAHLDRLYQPIGLPIHAETPSEIAISVLAEITAVRRGAKVSELREKWNKNGSEII